MNFNQVIVAGNLTRDPEINYTPNGTAIAKLGLAVNEKRKDKDGQMKEVVTFVDATAFGKTAEAIGQYFRKGRCIFLQGRLKTDEWQDKATGQKRTKLGVIVDAFQFGDSKPAGNGGEGAPAQAPAAQRQAAPAAAPSPIEDSDVPF